MSKPTYFKEPITVTAMLDGYNPRTGHGITSGRDYKAIGMVTQRRRKHYIIDSPEDQILWGVDYFQNSGKLWPGNGDTG